MTQKINCRFQEYCLSEKPEWLPKWFPERFHKAFMSISETLGTEYYRKNRSFILTLEDPELFLVPKSKFSVAKSLIDSCQTDKAEFEFKVVKWRFRWQEKEPLVDLDIREVKLTPLQMWFSNLPQGWQYALALISIVLAVAIIIFSGYSVYNYPEPRGFWVWFGQHVRGIVGWGLFFSLLILEIWAVYKFDKFPFIQNVLLVLLSFSSLLIPAFWLYLSLPPQPLSGIQYLDYLRTHLATFILLLAGNILWLAPLIKWLGWDLLIALAKVTPKGKDKSPE